MGNLAVATITGTHIVIVTKDFGDPIFIFRTFHPEAGAYIRVSEIRSERTKPYFLEI